MLLYVKFGEHCKEKLTETAFFILSKYTAIAANVNVREYTKITKNCYDKKNPSHQSFIFILKYVFCKQPT